MGERETKMKTGFTVSMETINDAKFTSDPEELKKTIYQEAKNAIEAGQSIDINIDLVGNEPILLYRFEGQEGLENFKTLLSKCF